MIGRLAALSKKKYPHPISTKMKNLHFGFHEVDLQISSFAFHHLLFKGTGSMKVKSLLTPYNLPAALKYAGIY